MKKYVIYTERRMPPAMAQIVLVDDLELSRFDEEKKELIPLRTLRKGSVVLCLGEIKNMPGHIAFVDDRGEVQWGYHPDNFREYDEERDI